MTEFALLLIQSNGEYRRIKARGISWRKLCAQAFGVDEEAPEIFRFINPRIPFTFFFLRAPALDPIPPGQAIIPQFINNLVEPNWTQLKPTALLVGRTVRLDSELDFVSVISPTELRHLERLLQRLKRDQERQDLLDVLSRVHGVPVSIEFDKDELDEPIGPFPLFAPTPSANTPGEKDDEEEDEQAVAPTANEEEKATSTENKASAYRGDDGSASTRSALLRRVEAMLDDDDGDDSDDSEESLTGIPHHCSRFCASDKQALADWSDISEDLSDPAPTTTVSVSQEGQAPKPRRGRPKKNPDQSLPGQVRAEHPCDYMGRWGKNCSNEAIYFTERANFCEAHRCPDCKPDMIAKMTTGRKLCNPCRTKHRREAKQARATTGQKKPVTPTCSYKYSGNKQCTEPSTFPIGSPAICEAHRCSVCRFKKMRKGQKKCYVCQKQGKTTTATPNPMKRKLRSHDDELIDQEEQQPPRKRRRLLTH